MPKFKVTKKVNGVIVSNFIEIVTPTEDIFFIYQRQVIVADEWNEKLQKFYKSSPSARFCELVSVEQVN